MRIQEELTGIPCGWDIYQISRISNFKKPERIEALARIMVLTLMIYSISERMIRKRMHDTGETTENQLKSQSKGLHSSGLSSCLWELRRLQSGSMEKCIGRLLTWMTISLRLFDYSDRFAKNIMNC